MLKKQEMENKLNKNQLPTWEVFVQPKSGASFQHAGNLHAIDEEMALQKYQSLRIVRTARVQLGSRLIGEYIYHPDGVIAQVRNQAISDLTPEQWCDRLEWLYGKNIFLNGLTV